MKELVRLSVRFTGHVQGVGFRFTAVEEAERFPDVSGYVRNMSDGAVELVAEGPSEAAQEFVRAVSNVMGGYIHDIETRSGAATGEFSRFAIQR